MRWIRTAFLTLLLAPLALLGACQLGMLQPAAPSHLGVTAGRLAPPSATDNSVSSQARLWPGHPQAEAAFIAPLSLPAGLALDEGWARLRREALALPGAQLVAADGDYLHIRYETRWLRFVDDAEFWLDRAQGVVQLRSASRLGQRDFGVNRGRIEALRAALSLKQPG